VKKIILLFEHEKKILGRPSIGNITIGDQALVNAVQKVAATPTTARYDASNYATMLKENCHCINGLAIKEASCPLKKRHVVPLLPKLTDESQKVGACTKMLASIPAERNGKLGQQVLDTCIFKPEEVNCDLHQKLMKRIKLFEH
jgi:hypothetical protein